MHTHFKAEGRNKLVFVETIYANVLSFQVWRDLVVRKSETKRHNRDVKTPTATKHDEDEMKFDFDPNVLATQLGEVGNGLQREKSINAPGFRAVEQPPSPHSPTQLAKGEQCFQKASRSGKSVSFQVLYRADSQLVVCLKQIR
jgi:hypothetical protein